MVTDTSGFNAQAILTEIRPSSPARLKRNEYMKNYMRLYRAKKKANIITSSHALPAIQTTATVINPPTTSVWGE